MMEGGRKRKPTALLKLSGSKHGRHREDPPAIMLQELPEPPEWLSAEAVSKWKDLGAILVRWGVLAESDLDVLAQYCHEFVLYKLAVKMVNEQGMVVEGLYGPKVNPALVAQEKTLNRMDRLGTYLGLTPSSRSKLKATPKPSEQDQKSKFFAGGA